MLVALLLAATVPSAAAAAGDGAPAADARRISPEDISRALDAVSADPTLTPQRTIKTLKWTGPTRRTTTGSARWIGWIAGIVVWLVESARRLVWLGGATLLGMLVVYLVRLAKRRPEIGDTSLVAPTHVQSLDIRPESLPADIAAAVRALWDAGDRRAGLALLYRGMLSRLIHVHRVPIRDSSTEGECVELAAKHLTPRRSDYAARLIRVWQRVVYGGEEVPAPLVHALCGDFAAVLDRPSPPTPPAPSGAA
jgi:hypothetical protein